ncbi:MAG TPA: hypothetical protein DEP18_03685 [Flavobacteriales bacterium]|nr:hypothetical protein [Flavobacteriales bacterium]HRE75374.1 hypothetical protein [Flavobacteriales bacterium]HRE95798.1 hypothetical protein [Flavobacteriales bacterium]HRJ37566.1 hypothetical protein [Flavobacteriales bacterium]
MDLELEQRYQHILSNLEKDLGEKPDMQTVIFLIGVQELNKGYQKLSKQEKLEVMHIGVCVLLSPYGFYSPLGRDEEGWPHFESKKKLPPLDGRQQQYLLKQAIVDYFTE